MEDVLDTLTGIIAILSCIALPIGLGMYLSLRNINTRHKERMELIRQGIVPPDDRKKPTPNRYRSLRNGFLCIGIALGILVGYISMYQFDMDEEENLFVFGSAILFFLGLAYILFYMITSKKNDSNKNGFEDDID